MNCADLEILICDYVDGTLAPETRAEVERHLTACPGCAELARDSAAAVSFMERAADVEPPPELLTRILFDPPWAHAKAGTGVRNWLRRLFSPVLQPRFAMGMAMTILSLAMLARFVAPVRQLKASDLDPAKVWTSIDDTAYRAWQRTVKFYESIRFVYQVQSTLRDWQQQQEEDQKATEQEAPAGDTKGDSRRLPVSNPPGSPGAGGARK